MDKLYRVVIIDDDEFSADNLCLELKKYNRLSIDGMARNGANGRKLLEKVHPDLLFLDVELPDMKGMELLEQLRGAITWNMQIVFYTAYDKYMIYAIRGAAFDYLLKPIDKKELEGIIDCFMKKAEESAAASLVIPPRVYSVGEHTFMISTPINDLRILRSIDIGFFRNILKRGKHDAAVLLNHHQIIDINDIRLMDLDEAGVISLDMIGRSIFLQQQRQLVVQHHFPQFPVGVITEKTDVNGAQNAQVIDGCGYH